MELIPKAEFKAHALEVLGEIEQSGQSRIITDRGKPILEIRKLRQRKIAPLDLLKGTVLKYDAAIAPVDDEWESA